MQDKLDRLTAIGQWINAVSDEINTVIKTVGDHLSQVASIGLRAVTDPVIRDTDGDDRPFTVSLAYGRISGKFQFYAAYRTQDGEEQIEEHVHFGNCTREVKLLLIAAMPQLLDRLIAEGERIEALAQTNLSAIKVTLGEQADEQPEAPLRRRAPREC